MVKKKHKASPPSLTRGRYVIRRGGAYYLDNACNFQILDSFKDCMQKLKVFDSNAEAKEYAVIAFDMKTVVIEKLSEIASTYYVFTPKGDVDMILGPKHEDDSFADAKSKYLKRIAEQTKEAQKELTALSKEFFKKRDVLLAEIQKCDQHHDTFIKALKAKQWVV